MPVERQILTLDQVTKAENRIGISHPILTQIDNYLPEITRFQQGYPPTDSKLQQRYISENFGFFADVITEVGPFTLKPHELISIWSRTKEVFSTYQRYALAGIVSSAYAVQEAENQEWKKFPRYYLETGEIPDVVKKDKSGLLHVQNRLKLIDESLNDLSSYVHGTREPIITYTLNLARREREGDLEAKRELEVLLARQQNYQNPTITEIHENFGNGFTPLFFPIGKALSAL